MATPTLLNLRQAGEAVVRRHIEAEERHDVEATVATFHKPRYEVAPLGVSDGAAEVRDLLSTMLTGFPDWHIEPGAFRYGDDFVFVEVQMTGTHQDPGQVGRDRAQNGPQSCVRL